MEKKKVSSKKFYESILSDNDENSDADQAENVHSRQDSNGSNLSKKKEGVSNSIKALQDKITKGLDLNDVEDPLRSPPLSVKSYRSQYERDFKSQPSYKGYKPNGVKSPNLSSQQPMEMASQVKLKKVVKNENKTNSIDSTFDKPYKKMSSSTSNDHLKSLSTTKLPSSTIVPKTAAEKQTSSSSSSTPISSPLNKKKPVIPQFKVVKKLTSPPMSPTSPIDTNSIASTDSSSSQRQELKQLQIIDKEISRKIKKIKSEIKFIDDSLPPNPCVHDFQSRKKLASAKQTLEKNLEFWEKKKYENGINFSKSTRKVVYSGGEEVTTFFSGRME